MPEAIGKETIGRVKLPLRELLELSLRNIRRRQARATVTIVTVVLGVSFLSFLTMTSIVLSQYAGAGVSVEAYQYWLAFISLLLCVVSITNSMIIAVYERYREIGIIKCLGALDRHVISLFFVESTVMGLVGGGLGFLCGSVTAMAIYGLQLGFDVVLKIPLFESLSCFFLSLTVAFTISVCATLYPAYKAAKSNPVEAFRVEI